MAQTNVRAQMQQRRDTAANWTSENPILLSGEIGYETDTGKFKIGDGSTAWSSLNYLPIPNNSNELNGNLTVTGTLGVNTNLGVGTSSPAELLHIDGGNGIISGNLALGTTDFTTDLGYARKFKVSGSGPAIYLEETDVSQSYAIAALGGNLYVRDATALTARIALTSGGNVGINISNPAAPLHVNGDRVRIATAKTPASASDTGATGEVCWDASYIYVCTATNTWKRAALSTW